jgi:hypothetical protein
MGGSLRVRACVHAPVDHARHTSGARNFRSVRLEAKEIRHARSKKIAETNRTATRWRRRKVLAVLCARGNNGGGAEYYLQ